MIDAAIYSAAEPPFFRPRRFAHANLWVSDYQKSSDFYQSVAGFREVYRQPANAASFVSNGNTYHDFGLTSTSSKYAQPGQAPGQLFHVALELESEAELVRCYQRALAAGLTFRSTVDHDVAHSVYLYDPDGTVVELYADVDADWRAHRQGVVEKPKPKWIPGASGAPLAQPLYPQDPVIEKIDEAVFHGKRATHAALVTARFEDMLACYTKVVGLALVAGHAGGDYALLEGFAGQGDLSLHRQRPGLEPGLHHVGIEVWGEDDLSDSLVRLQARGLSLESQHDHPARRSVFVRDPDGIRLQFNVTRDWRAENLERLTAQEALHIL